MGLGKIILALAMFSCAFSWALKTSIEARCSSTFVILISSQEGRRQVKRVMQGESKIIAIYGRTFIFPDERPRVYLRGGVGWRSPVIRDILRDPFLSIKLDLIINGISEDNIIKVGDQTYRFEFGPEGDLTIYTVFR